MHIFHSIPYYLRLYYANCLQCAVGGHYAAMLFLFSRWWPPTEWNGYFKTVRPSPPPSSSAECPLHGY